MSIWNPFAFTPTGQPVAPVAPPALRVIDGQATAQQLAMAQQVFVQFSERARLSVVPNPVEVGALPDGSQYKITVVGPQTTMLLWPRGNSLLTARSGIIFEVVGDKRWLLVNAPRASGGSSAKWELRDITADYPIDSPGALNSLQSNAQTTRISGGKWKYTYRKGGLGQYGHVGTYTLPGDVTSVTTSGVVLGTEFSPLSKFFLQYTAVKRLTQMPAPPYGSKGAEQVPPQAVDYTADAVLIDANGIGLDDYTKHPVSPDGRYLAMAIRRTTGLTATWLGALEYPPNDYQVKIALWPEPRYSVGVQVNLSATNFSLSTTPSVYDEEALALKVFEATDAGYVLKSEKVIGQLESSCTPTIGRLTSAGYVSAARHGVMVTNQFWPYPLRISSYSVHEIASGYVYLNLYAVHSETYGFRITKDLREKNERMEGVDLSGNPLTFVDELEYTYQHDYARPTTTNVHTREGRYESGYTPPVIGVDVASGYTLSYTSSGTFHSGIDCVRKVVRKYSDLEIDLEKSVVRVDCSGDFLQETTAPGIAWPDYHQSSSETTYTSLVESREVLFRDPIKRVTVYSEVITTLSHLSTESEVLGDVTLVPSTQIPVTVGKVWIVCRGQRVSVDVTSIMSTDRIAGYVNVGRAVTELGEQVFVSDGPPLALTNPIGGRIGYADPQSNFLYTGSFNTLAQAVKNVLPSISVTHATCPESGGMLIRFAGRRFLIDDVSGIRDADAVVSWPHGVAGADFFTF